MSAVERVRPEELVPAAGWPAEVAVRLARSGISDRYVVYERAGGWWFGAAPAVEIVADAGTVQVQTPAQTWSTPAAGDPIRAAGRVLESLSFTGQAYGWAAFELAHVYHGTGDPPGPLLHLMVPGIEVHCAEGVASIRTGDPALLPRVMLAASERAEPEPGPPVVADLDHDAERYRCGVAAVVRDIAEGRLDKAVLSRAVPLAGAVDFGATYLAGRAANTPARSFLLDLGGWRAAGFSPETVVEVSADGTVSTQPLAGTRRLAGTRAVNDALRAELLADPKEIHEHAVSVKLAFVELESVCESGSVAVREFMEVRERGSVQHLASRATGRLAGTRWDALAALFPAVTATGVAKRPALQALAQYETGPRGLYGGVVFTAGSDGSLDAALVLRTVFAHQGRAWLRAGAGVVGGSDPDRELEETREKLRSIAPYLREQR